MTSNDLQKVAPPMAECIMDNLKIENSKSDLHGHIYKWNMYLFTEVLD